MIILRDRQGNERSVLDGTPFRLKPGEVVIGSTQAAIKDELQESLAQHGIQWGDAVAKLTKVFGIKPCKPCEERRQILNRVHEIGLAETIKQLKETI